MDFIDLVEPFDRMLADMATPAVVRAIERGAPAAALWDAIAASGYLDALVPEASGGSGLPLAAVEPLWQSVGRHAVPLPVGETMIARALLVEAGATPPGGPIAIIGVSPPTAQIVPMAGVADHLLFDDGRDLYLLALDGSNRSATGVPASVAARVDIPAGCGIRVALSPGGGLRAAAALLRAALIAGAAGRLTEMSAAYANERVQFGKPIGRQQALQQNLAVMAEDMVAVRIASQLGSAGAFPPSVAAAATAKTIAGAAATRIAATAHAVHGAIGISEEHDLQLLTRRLHEWRLSDGSEGYWSRALGAARLASDAGSVDFVRTTLPLGSGN